MEVQHLLITYILCLLMSTSTGQLARLQLTSTGSGRITVHNTPEIHDMIRPNVGPLSGLTKLTLTGSNLDVPGLTVRLGGEQCPIVGRNSTTIICLTQPAGNDKLNIPLDINMEFGCALWTLMQTFTYRPDPLVTSIEPTETILSGGTLMTVTGVGLDVVGEPRLQVTVLEYEMPVHVLESICQIVSSTTMHCVVPYFDIFGPDGELDLNALYASTTPSTQTGASERKRRSIDSTHRHRRQAGGTVNSDKIGFQVGVVLDGVRMYKTFTNATVYVDPELYRWKEVEEVTRFRSKLEVKGANLLRGLQTTDYTVLIGQSECGSLSAYDNLLECTAPKDIPAPHKDDMDTTGLLQVRILFGLNKEGIAGKLRYNTDFFDDPYVRWGIIAAGIVIVVIILIVIAICIRKKCRSAS